jgi:hypothetical protein
VGVDGSNTTGFAAGGNGGAGYTLTSIDSNLTAANMAVFSGMTVVASGGGGGALDNVAVLNQSFGVGGTGAGNGATGGAPTSPTSFGSGGGGGGYATTVGTAGYAGLVIVKYS